MEGFCQRKCSEFIVRSHAHCFRLVYASTRQLASSFPGNLKESQGIHDLSAKVSKHEHHQSHSQSLMFYSLTANARVFPPTS